MDQPRATKVTHVATKTLQAVNTPFPEEEPSASENSNRPFLHEEVASHIAKLKWIAILFLLIFIGLSGYILYAW